MILGISAFYHDSAAALIQDGVVIAAAQEERFTRKKHDAGFPVNAAKYCLEHAGCSLDELDAVAFYDKPMLKFERLLETYQALAPRGVASFVTAIPVWIKEKLFFKKMLHEGLAQVSEYDRKKLQLLFPEHHLSHAASAFYPSPFEEAAILTIDGVGEWATASICHGKGKNISILKEMRFPHSIGLLYSAFTYFLGFKVNSGEYKLMGLAPYGNADSPEVARYIQTIKEKLCELQPDGSVFLNQEYFTYATGLRMVPDKKWEKLFGFPSRKPEEDVLQHHCDLAIAIQMVTEEAVLLMAQEAQRLTGSHNLCMAGGVALNCVANGKLWNSGIFKQLFIQPAAGDAGGAPGAAWAAQHIYFEQERQVSKGLDGMSGSYLGPDITNDEVNAVIRRHKAVARRFDDEAALCREVAALLDAGKVVGWVQGRMEFGPRALGARSILGDPRSPDMQKRLNLKIKYRESFRPFAPSVLREDVSDWFDLNADSPYMLLVEPVGKAHLKALPSNYNKLPLLEKLYIQRSDLPAITHVDHSARIQTVHRETNPRYHALLQAFKSLTGCPVLVNTSFNVRGEPIVCTAEDAYRCFMSTDMDYLVCGDFVFEKGEQPEIISGMKVLAGVD